MVYRYFVPINLFGIKLQSLINNLLFKKNIALFFFIFTSYYDCLAKRGIVNVASFNIFMNNTYIYCFSIGVFNFHLFEIIAKQLHIITKLFISNLIYLSKYHVGGMNE